MTSREKILAAVRKNQPTSNGLPTSRHTEANDTPLVGTFMQVLGSIGGAVIKVDSPNEIQGHLSNPGNARIVTTVEALTFAEQVQVGVDPHTLQDVHTAIIEGIFGVAENGAIWITEEQLKVRALPFICEHLVIVLSQAAIVPNMHEAYYRIGVEDHSFGVFIAGPSKTADIEQSLVLGAHGSRTLSVFLTP
jgi:L-lactate dehydrogenase complex protein LldG